MQLEQARAAKQVKVTETESTLPEASSSVPADSPQPSTSDASFGEPTDPVIHTKDERIYDEHSAMANYALEWVESLSRDDLLSLSILLWYLLVGILSFKLTDAAEMIGKVLRRSDRTVREWRVSFNANKGTFPDTMQGKYQRDGVLWNNEELNEIATRYVRENTVVKGRPNLTAGSFCQWVNECLLTTQTLEPGYPRHISVETARKWLLELGFTVMEHKKGTYVDGHERPDVVQYRSKFLRQLSALGFLNKHNAPTPEAVESLPSDLECSSDEQIAKTVVIFHDETTFQANDDQTRFWGAKDMTILRPKSKGAGIMVSDFIDEHNGYLQLSDEEYERSKSFHPGIKKYARKYLEYGENKEGYWTSEKFMTQIEDAAKIAEIKYPRDEGYRLVWVFDHSSCHGAYADDALNAYKMNAKPGGKQPAMHNTIWRGKEYSMVFNIGVSKGLLQVLKERGVDTRGMKLEDMRKELASHEDFKNEKTKIEHYLNNRGHCCMLLPKFHCEINPIERCWAQAKHYVRAHTNYTLSGLRQRVPEGLDSVTLENIKNHFRKVRHYMFGYLLGIAAGPELEEHIKKCKKIYTSHRRIGVNE